MRYRVLWTPEAEERLEQIVRNARDARRVGVAAREIDQELLIAPHAFGESRAGATRVAWKQPLGIYFEVMDDVRTVVVYDVWRTDRIGF